MNARFLDVRESQEHVSGLRDGMDKAAQWLNATLREIDSGTKEWFTRIDLGSPAQSSRSVIGRQVSVPARLQDGQG